MFVVEKIQNALNDRSKSPYAAPAFIVGVAYSGILTTRAAARPDIMHLLKRRGARLELLDPYAPGGGRRETMQSQDLDEAAAAADCVVIVTDHSSVDYRGLVERA